MALEKPFDHSLWDRFLKRYVNEEGAVDYQGVLEEPELMDQYREQVNTISLDDFPRNWPREELLALWLNVYHLGVIQAVRENYPVKSIQSIPGVWDIQVVAVAGKSYSLNDIRRHQLILSFRDEKIHAALACGARSCPALSREAFTGSRVEGQLYVAARRFVNDAQRNRITPGKKKIQLSRIFKWYAPDFKLDFGSHRHENWKSPEEFAVLSFVAHYLDDSLKIDFLEEGQYKVKYLKFDWDLNEWAPGQDAFASPSFN